MYSCESWAIKKAEQWRIGAFELWCWRRLLRVPWTSRRSNQSLLKEINLEYSLEGLMLKLKLQYFGPLLRRVDCLEKTLMLWRIKDRRWRRWQRMRRLDGITEHELEQAPGVGDGQGIPGVLQSMQAQSQTWLSDWTELICYSAFYIFQITFRCNQYLCS